MQLTLLALFLLLGQTLSQDTPWIGQAQTWNGADWLRHHEQLVNHTVEIFGTNITLQDMLTIMALEAIRLNM